jgi:hypothetical protein
VARLFVSYSRDDSSRVDRLISALESAGHIVWIDRSGITVGTQWRKQIVEAIAGSDSFVVVLSKNSSASDEVRRELDIAVESHIRILPLDLDPVAISPEMTYQLAGLQRIDLSKEFNSGIGSLLNALQDQPRDLVLSQLSLPVAVVTTRSRRRTFGIGALVGLAVGPAYSTIHIALREGIPRDLSTLMFYLTFALFYGILGAVAGAVFAGFWTQSKVFRRSTVVATMVACAIISAVWLSPLSHGLPASVRVEPATALEAVWHVTFLVLPLSLSVGMLVGGMAVGMTKWMFGGTGS